MVVISECCFCQQKLRRGLRRLLKLVYCFLLKLGLVAANNTNETWWHIMEIQAISANFGKLIQIAIVKHFTLGELDFWSILLSVVALRFHTVLNVCDKLYTFYEARQLNFFIAFTVSRTAPILKPLNRYKCIQTIREQPCDDDHIFILLVHEYLSFFLGTLLMHPV